MKNVHKIILNLLVTHSLIFFQCSNDDSRITILEQTTIDEIESRTVFIHSPKLDIPNGTGVLLDSKGTVITCLHTLIAIEDSIQVIIGDGKTRYAAKILKKQVASDLVLLETELKTNLKPLKWKSVDEFSKGDKVFLIGTPYGLTNSLMTGVISKKNRIGASLQFPKIPYIQVQGIAYPGNSGATVYTSDGKAIGINQSTYGFSTGTGIGLVIPSSLVKEFLDQAQKSGAYDP